MEQAVGGFMVMVVKEGEGIFMVSWKFFGSRVKFFYFLALIFQMNKSSSVKFGGSGCISFLQNHVHL